MKFLLQIGNSRFNRFCYISAYYEVEGEKYFIGFRDFRINKDNIASDNGSVFNLPEHAKFPDVDFHPDLRYATDNIDSSASFVVIDEFRSKGLGRSLFFTGLQMAKLLGAQTYLVM